MNTARSNRTLRAALLGSAAGLCMIAGVAQAQDLGRPDLNNVVRESQDDGPVAIGGSLREAQDAGPVSVGGAELVPEIVINSSNGNTPTTARDPNNITGVGQMILDEQNGFIGLCTGTLINPRTVIFAAHCVNERAANAYGQDSGGQPIGFGFSNSNNTAGASAFGTWLNGGSASGGVKYASTPSLYMYDANYVAYNPLSTEPNAAGFLYGDIAMASLDTPAANVPTWALLFSQLPAVPITAAGTGYHVTIDGYGNNGTGTAGSTGGIDYRRRIAENTLGALASLGDFEQFLFGSGGTTSTTNPQNLYWIDFDDPRRGTASASPYDFNAWRDNALPQEGITASGDSGGPLILDRAYAKQLVIGVLSGGYTRFYSAQPANGYGTAAFYQPLYLYWDWIAANNPYHYVSAVAGNGAWTDPTHWVTNLDPNYYVLSGGAPVNGVPTTPGAGNTDQPGFGQACFQTATVSDCYDVATGTETVATKPIGTASDDPANVSTGSVADDKGAAESASLGDGEATGQVYSKTDVTSGYLTAQDASAQAVAALPTPTLANGLPGATGFVPNNDDGNRLTSTAPKYFDVTLSANGTTTLGTAATVDRFTLSGAGAMLDIQAGGSLTSLMSITQGIGTMQVNGSLTTPGDYMALLGGINGTGTITTPFFTSVAATISPGSTGAAGAVGTLNFRGNVILSSGTTYMVDIAGAGSSDKIAVAATTFSGSQVTTGQKVAEALVPTNGIANIGGRVQVNFTNAVRANDLYTILTAEGGVTGTFLTPAAISAILTPKFIYSANAVQMQIQAGLYTSVVDRNSSVQGVYATLLDQNRGGPSGASGLYATLDLQSVATIRAALDALAPTTETIGDSTATATVETTTGFFTDRLSEMNPSNLGGTFARYGAPTQVAALNLNGMGGISGMGFGGASVMNDSSEPMMQASSLPETMAAFVAGGYIDGDSSAMRGSPVTGRDNYNGWYVAGGIETQVDDSAAIGFALTYSRVDGTGAMVGQTARSTTYLGTLYGKYVASGGLAVDTQFSAGLLDNYTKRSVSFLGTPYTLTSDDHALVINSEVGIGKDFDLTNVKVTPRVAFRGTHVELTPTAETGGPMALQYNRVSLDSAQGRAGLTIGGTGKVRPWVSGSYVHDFIRRQNAIAANFVGSNTAGALFLLNNDDQDWFEASGGITLHTGSVDLSASAETTLDRGDLSNQTYRGSISFRF